MKTLKQSLGELVQTYGAEEVMSALNNFEPFKSRRKEMLTWSRENKRQSHKRSYRDVRSRDALIKTPVIDVHIHHWRDEKFTVAALSTQIGARAAHYTEPISQFEDFINWMKERGFVEHPKPILGSEFITELVHAERYQHREAELETKKGRGSLWDAWISQPYEIKVRT